MRLVLGETGKVKVMQDGYDLASPAMNLVQKNEAVPFRMRYPLPRIPQSLLQFLFTPLALGLTSKFPLHREDAKDILTFNFLGQKAENSFLFPIDHR